jgi:hypothetical protein
MIVAWKHRGDHHLPFKKKKKNFLNLFWYFYQITNIFFFFKHSQYRQTLLFFFFPQTIDFDYLTSHVKIFPTSFHVWILTRPVSVVCVCHALMLTTTRNDLHFDRFGLVNYCLFVLSSFSSFFLFLIVI